MKHNFISLTSGNDIRPCLFYQHVKKPLLSKLAAKWSCVLFWVWFNWYQYLPWISFVHNYIRFRFIKILHGVQNPLKIKNYLRISSSSVLFFNTSKIFYCRCCITFFPMQLKKSVFGTFVLCSAPVSYNSCQYLFKNRLVTRVFWLKFENMLKSR